MKVSLKCFVVQTCLNLSLLVVKILSAVLEDAREFSVVELAVLDGRLFVQIVHLVLGKAIAQRGQQFAQIILIQGAWKKERNLLQPQLIQAQCPRSAQFFTEKSEGIS